MKKKWIIALLILLTTASCNSKKEKIITFNDQIITEQEAVINAESNLVNSISDRHLELIDSNYNLLLNQIIHSENNVNSITDPDPEVGFKQSALTLFSTFKEQTQNGYKTLVELSKVPDSLYTSKQEKEFEEISSTIFITINAEVSKFIITQQKLADKHNFSFKK